MDVVICSKNYDGCCRTCLCDGSEEMYSIFDHNEESVNVVEILSRYTSIKVTTDDELPKKLCSACYQHLLSFHNFTNIAIRSDTRLKEYYCNLPKSQVKQECNDIIKELNEMTIKNEFSTDNTEYNYLSEENIDSNIFTETKKVIKHSKIKLKCKRKIKNQCIYDRHLLPYTKEYYCTQCNTTFKDRRCYVKHVINHNQVNSQTLTPAQNQSVVCDICSISFNSIQSLSAHKKVHKDKDRVLQCTVCNKVFKKYSNLKRHELSSAHKDVCPYKCMLCKKSYATEESLAVHVKMHNGVKSHHCPVCMRMFGHLRTLRTHIKMHMQEKPYLCPTCGKMFDSSTNLNQHLKRHAGEKLFACDLCPKRFFSKGELKSHSVTHSGERSFSCEQCNKLFPKRSSLEKHKITHTGVKPHQCDVCSMKFRDKNHLKRHYRIHTGEKPYRCEICDRRFTQSNDLLKHKRTHLGNNLYKCDECSQSFRLKKELRQHISDHFISAQLGSKIIVDSEHAQISEGKNLEAIRQNILDYKEQ